MQFARFGAGHRPEPQVSRSIRTAAMRPAPRCGQGLGARAGPRTVRNAPFHCGHPWRRISAHRHAAPMLADDHQTATHQRSTMPRRTATSTTRRRPFDWPIPRTASCWCRRPAAPTLRRWRPRRLCRNGQVATTNKGHNADRLTAPSYPPLACRSMAQRRSARCHARHQPSESHRATRPSLRHNSTPPCRPDESSTIFHAPDFSRPEARSACRQSVACRPGSASPAAT